MPIRQTKKHLAKKACQERLPSMHKNRRYFKRKISHAHRSKNVDNIKTTEQGGIRRTPFFAVSSDCTVGAKSPKLIVSTRKSTKHVFASPERLQTRCLLLVMFSGSLFPEHPIDYPTDSSVREGQHDGAWLANHVTWHYFVRHHRRVTYGTLPNKEAFQEASRT